MLNPHTKGILQVLLGASCISLAPVFVKLVSEGPVVVGFYRMFFSVLMLLSWISVRRLRDGKIELNRHYFWLLLAGGFFAGDLSMWHQSIILLGPGIATLVVNTQVIILALLGVMLYREPCTAKLVLSIGIAMIGLVLISGASDGTLSNDQHLWGVILALLAACSYSMYILVLKNTQNRYLLNDKYVQLMMICIGAAIATGVIALLQHESFEILSTKDAVYLVLYALVVQVIGWSLIVWGLPHISLTQAGILLLAQPTLAYLWDVMLFGKTTVLLEALGVICLFCAIALGSVKKKTLKRAGVD